MFAGPIGYAGLVITTVTLVLAAQVAPARAHFRLERVSLGSGGTQGNGFSECSALSADSRFVAFCSAASNLVPGDKGETDIFIRDRKLGTTRRVSVGPGGAQANGSSSKPALSADGRFVAFESDATDLVPGDTNGWRDVFVRDRAAGTTERVSVSSAGVQGHADSLLPTISADGRFVAFTSFAGLVPGGFSSPGVFVRDRLLGTAELVSVGTGGAQGNFGGFAGVISANGRFVAFVSASNNLVPDDTNNDWDIFVRDRKLGTTRRVSADSGGLQGNGESLGGAVSANGLFVAFASDASNLVPGDTNNFSDVFVRIPLD